MLSKGTVIQKTPRQSEFQNGLEIVLMHCDMFIIQ